MVALTKLPVKKEDVKNSGHTSYSLSSDIDEPLKFTGNWFIDAGILGFVNLMEEVYGEEWKKETGNENKDFLTILQEKIKKEPEKIYYGYFPFAYLFYHSKISNFYDKLYNKQKGYIPKLVKKYKELRNEKDSKKKKRLMNDIIKLKNKIEEMSNELKKEKIMFKKYLDQFIEDIMYDSMNNFSHVKEKIERSIPSFKLKMPSSHRNFFIYNPRKDLFHSFIYLYYLLKEDFKTLYEIVSKISKNKKNKGLTYEIRPNSTINPFLISDNKFSNLLFTSLLSVEDYKKYLENTGIFIPIYTIFLSFFNSFIYYFKYILFYSPSMKFTYFVNKKLKRYSEYLRKEGKQNILLSITWKSIFDVIIEHKSLYSLENMYLIEYTNIENQQIKNVEYIEIPKIQAYLLLDDIIRDALNNKITVVVKNHSVWILEEFIKNRPLYPLILKHISYTLSNNLSVSSYASLYSLAVEAKLQEYKTNSNNLFSLNFFNKLFLLRRDVKKTFRMMNFYGRSFVSLFKNKEEKLKYAYDLLTAIKKTNKVNFVNTVLKKIIESENEEKYRIQTYLFEYIVKRDFTWQYYALGLIIGLLNERGDNYDQDTDEE